MFEASEGVRTAEDFYRAAMLFQHGTEASDWRKARELALRAVELHPEYREAKWLAAAALDRELIRTGKRQRYGTQYRDVGGRLELYPVDPATTDEQRAQWGLPPLREAQEAAAQMNDERK